MSRLKPSVASTPRISADDDGTDDEDLGFDPKKPKATANKLDLFEDILGGALGEAKRPATASATAPQPMARRHDERRPAVSRQSTETTENSTAPRPKTSTGRRGSGFSITNNPDPLGLFSQPAKETQQPGAQSAIATKKRGSTADWLGLTVTADPTHDLTQIETRAESPKPLRSKQVNHSQTAAYDILKLNDTLEPQEAHDVADMVLEANEPTVTTTASIPAAQTMLKLSNMNLETRGAITMLQQQESQLAIATQMKQQERCLIEMQRKQETLLQQQELQFENLMQQQLQRQQTLEANIKLQQQRINAHIELLLNQPAAAFNFSTPLHHGDYTKNATAIKHAVHEEGQAEDEDLAASPKTADRIQMETDSRRLELEKLRLEELVANTKANYEKEIEIIEATYKKQFKLLDEHADAMETRLRAEITAITEFYKQKIAVLEEEQLKSKSTWESEVLTLKQDHEEELRRLRKTHEEDLDLLRDEQRRMVEAIQRSKMLEFAAVQDNGNYLDTLKAASANLSEATTDLQSLREQLQTKLEAANSEREKNLKARESLLEDKERHLQINEASAEEEKGRLMKLVANLEQQLTALNKEASEENWQLRLKLSALEADKAAFEREKEYAREQMQRDEQRLASMKAEQIAEMQRVKLELQDERRLVQLEKTRYETQLKLRSTNNDSLEKERCDLEVSMKCAHEAARQADDERQRYFTRQCELEQLKRELVDKEAALRAKQEQLQMELRTCASIEEQAKDSAKRARLIEQSFQEKLLTLQQRTRELAEKESYLAEERQLIAQQRLALKEAQMNAVQRRCPACQEQTLTNSKNVSHQDKADGQAHNLQSQKSPMYVVDKLLDDNIAESFKRLETSVGQQQKPLVTTAFSADTLCQPLSQQQHNFMYVNPNSHLWSMLHSKGFLDDDSKTLALNNYDHLQYDTDLMKLTEPASRSST